MHAYLIGIITERTFKFAVLNHYFFFYSKQSKLVIGDTVYNHEHFIYENACTKV
jgi:hypothetical protein